jgi:hypothetical protein
LVGCTSGIEQDIFLLGIIVAMLSLTSLVQHLANIPMADVSQTIVESYRSVADEAKRILFDWWIARVWPSWEMPSWLFDLLAAWTLAGTSGSRAKASFWSHVVSPDGHILYRTRRTGRDAPSAFDFFMHILFGPISLIVVLVLTIDQMKSVGLFGHPRTIFVKAENGNTLVIFESNAASKFLRLLAPMIGTALFFVWNGISL